MQPKWIALIPAYQPTKLLLPLLAEAKSSGFHLIIVNDGSSRETDSIFRQAAGYGTVLNHSSNLGKGKALKTGLSYILSHYSPNSIVVTMDADGQHKVSDAQKICLAAQSSPETLVLGSRKLRKDVPLRSLLGNTITRLIYHISTGQKIRDTQTGLRAFSAGMIPKLLCIPGERYEYEMNVLLTCSRDKISIREEEIDTIYINGNAGSHFDAMKDSYLVYKEILKFSAASLVSFFLDYSLYCLLTLLTSGYGKSLCIGISNVGARMVSASVNYTLNRSLVFQSRAPVGSSAVQYAGLAAAILAGNTVLLNILVNQLGMNPYAAKLITEFTFFFVSWMVQRQIIFPKRNLSASPHKK